MAIETDDPGYIESLLPTPAEEYDALVDQTFTRRLAIMLIKNGTISEREATDLFYPSMELIEEAGEFHP